MSGYSQEEAREQSVVSLSSSSTICLNALKGETEWVSGTRHRKAQLSNASCREGGIMAVATSSTERHHSPKGKVTNGAHAVAPASGRTC